MKIQCLTWVRYPARRRRKRLAKKIARKGGMRPKRVWIDTDLITQNHVGRHVSVVFYTNTEHAP